MHKKKLAKVGKPKTTPDDTRYHIDKRAAGLLLGAINDESLLTTAETAQWLGVSTQWLEIGRHRGYGPPFERLSPRCVRYRRSKVCAWLDARSYTHTAEYA